MSHKPRSVLRTTIKTFELIATFTALFFTCLLIGLLFQAWYDVRIKTPVFRNVWLVRK
jgi:hypothetical protein